MERLTARDDYNGATYYPKCFEEPCLGGGSKSDCDTCDFNAAICNRLAAYEDTGLTPEEVAALDHDVAMLKQSAGHANELAVEVNRLRAQLAASQRRERAAVRDIKLMMQACTCNRACHFCADGDCGNSPNCEPEWRGPQEARGHWIFRGVAGEDPYECSACGNGVAAYGYHYCPSCGTEMDAVSPEKAGKGEAGEIPDEMCKKCLLDWLQQPAETEDANGSK